MLRQKRVRLPMGQSVCLQYKKPQHSCYASNDIICRSNNQRDYKFAFNAVTRLPYSDDYRPFAYPTQEIKKGDYAVILRGSGSEVQEYVDGKTPSKDIYEEIIWELQLKGIRTYFNSSIIYLLV